MIGRRPFHWLTIPMRLGMIVGVIGIAAILAIAAE